MNELKEIMTRKELAIYLGTSTKTIERYEAKGLKPTKPERLVFYLKKDILDFFEKEGNKTK
ncbi:MULTISPECIES: helix-turn-helix transcriptional regulator [Helcococcus]|uniref:DNA-binding protein n=1 Tax=Helcococcus bovis TaxID=3153252 RepID=A0ABW9F773_9FIRM